MITQQQILLNIVLDQDVESCLMTIINGRSEVIYTATAASDKIRFGVAVAIVVTCEFCTTTKQRKACAELVNPYYTTMPIKREEEKSSDR